MPTAFHDSLSQSLRRDAFVRVWDVVLNLLFPPRCVGCGRVGAVWCDSCGHTLESLAVTVRTREVEGVRVIASGAHEGILQEAVQGLKYHGLRMLAHPLGARVADAVSSTGQTFDAVIAVPTPPQRLRLRGYNQAQLIAESTAQRLGVPCLSGALTRARETRSQVGLTRAERRQNVRGAFIALAVQVRGLRVLIVDDVCTTGATLAACASALREADASAVMAATVTEAAR
jgi:ComF family protein